MPNPKWYRVEDKRGETITRFNQRTKETEPKLYRSYLKAAKENPDCKIYQLRSKGDKVGREYTPPDWTLGKKRSSVAKSRFTGRTFEGKSAGERAARPPSKKELRGMLGSRGPAYGDLYGTRKPQKGFKPNRAVMTLHFRKKASPTLVENDIKRAWPGAKIEEKDFSGKTGKVRFTIPMREWEKGKKKFMKSKAYEDIRSG